MGMVGEWSIDGDGDRVLKMYRSEWKNVPDYR